MTPKPESETDPWAKVRTFDVSTYGDCRMERDYYGEIASEQKYQRGEYAWVDEVDAARAAEAAQHRQALRAGDAEIEACKREIARLTQEPFRLAQVLSEARARVAAVEAERDRLKAALSQITALDFEKFNGRHNFYSGAAMFVKAWLLAYAALTPQGQSTDGETR